ncbi:DUF3822 family protein [Pedobacter insulae]|uniref:DUF3822 domain-containing protein n=1 Tax=Pedobacter insulae TaxID=414048 RepID=A0A1I2UGM0_9SPHI|nr:DUF3822 family protein [Pedobacter insulae]SFG76292.1 Protein of unknown function [Pedobacter insulae]
MNRQNSILLIDPKFDPGTAVHCSLLVSIGMDSFSYAIVNNELKKVVAVYDEQEITDVSKNLGSRIKNDVYLGLSFAEIKIAVCTENHLAVPNELYQNEEPNLYTKFFPAHSSADIYTASHANFGFTSMYSFSKDTDEIINQWFANSKKYQPYSPLLKLAENNTGSSLYIDFTAGSMHVLFVADKNVIFQQCYEIESAEEFNYYILLISNQLSINFDNTQVYITGIIVQEDLHYGCLKKYFKAIHFLDFVDSTLDRQVLEDMPSHYYTTLLALTQCV